MNTTIHYYKISTLHVYTAITVLERGPRLTALKIKLYIEQKMHGLPQNIHVACVHCNNSA